MKNDTNIETPVHSFLAQKSIAVIGVSGKRPAPLNGWFSSVKIRNQAYLDALLIAQEALS